MDSNKTKCPICSKTIKLAGLKDHVRDVHDQLIDEDVSPIFEVGDYKVTQLMGGLYKISKKMKTAKSESMTVEKDVMYRLIDGFFNYDRI